MTVLVAAGVAHVYDPGTPWEHQALQRVDLTVAAGEGVAVHGRNGSGKSTLFWVLTGALAPTAGQVRIEGRPAAAAADRVGACLQSARLQLFGATVRDDLRLDPALGDARAATALEAVGLAPEEYLHRRVDELSGGEQRLVALAGALERHPALVVLDEPFAGLDRPRSLQLVAALERARGTGVATVVLTPDPEEAARCGRVAELVAGRLAC